MVTLLACRWKCAMLLRYIAKWSRDVHVHVEVHCAQSHSLFQSFCYQSLILMCILCVCVCVCVCPPQDLGNGTPHFFCQRKEILLASCTNCFSSLYDAWFKRKSLWNFSAGYMLKAVHARYTSGYPGQDESCSTLEHCWNILEEGHVLHIMGTIVDTAFNVNGLQIFAKYE